MYNIITTDLAKDTLRNIVIYISANLANKQAASDFLDEVNFRYNNLASTPFMYSLCKNLRLKRLGYRRVIIKNDIMVYPISEETETVFSLGLFYGGSLYEKIL